MVQTTYVKKISRHERVKKRGENSETGATQVPGIMFFSNQLICPIEVKK